MLQVVAAVGLTGYFSLRNGQKAVNQVAMQLRNEVTAHIQQQISNYIQTPQLVAQMNANAIHFEEISLQDASNLERRCWQQMALFQSLRPIAFSNVQGGIHAVDRLNDGTLVIRVIDASTGGKYHTYRTDDRGNRASLLEVNQTFDPRTRPWYRAAARASKPTWSEVYPYFSTDALAISAVQPLYETKTKKLLGVTNATLSLSQISQFLHTLKIGRSGQTFIVERSGNLVASSTTEKLFTLSSGKAKKQRLAATRSRDRITRLTAQYLQEHFSDLRRVKHSQQLDFEIGGERQLLQVTPFADAYGLDWLIVVIVPEADFMEHIEANTRIAILLCLGALLVATAIGMATSNWIAQPILRLSLASKSLAEKALTANLASGQLGQSVEANNIIELEVLAQAHSQMSTQLQGSFAALEKANEELELRVEQRTSELEKRTFQLQQAFDFEAMLKRITDKVRDSLDEGQILQSAVQELGLILKVDSCDTGKYNFEQSTSTICYEYITPGMPSAQGYVLLMTNLPEIHHQLLEGQPVQFCKLQSQARWGQKTLLACPIFDDQGVLGDLWLSRSKDAIFEDLEIRLVQQVANQCAIAIRQARLYQSAQAQVEELRELHQLKDDFLSTVSHELRTPISNMKLAIHMLKLGPEPVRFQKYLDILQAECNKEAALINDLLDLQKLEAERYSIFAGTIVLQDWIPALVEPFLSRAQSQQQTLQVDLSPELPPIVSDCNSLSRLLAELLNNACKYTAPGGGIRLQVHSASASIDADSNTTPLTIFAVSNEAEISDAELPRIFEKFYRVPQGDPWRQGGTGLGLALVQKLVEQLGGTLHVKSQAGWTTFTVALANLAE
ncbi:sensor histidine kinase [Leptolyngbya sp. FACHB-261]|uniref:sensor histidine kinase n=1 Tax=Leptolyngbya sp. FACHB-261 TaxID=2692806 RepID=UPI001688100C|nr:sensor histidine kinase [Leptolyngbya sp. FACHB-261]MBD2101229.1 GAF domain-containing protein [Leptolyngbya sp. FACHB-261]